MNKNEVYINENRVKLHLLCDFEHYYLYCKKAVTIIKTIENGMKKKLYLEKLVANKSMIVKIELRIYNILTFIFLKALLAQR